MARENLRISSDKHKRLYDTKSDPNKYKFQKGDLVWYYNDARKPGVCPKLTQSWHGPYQVTEVVTDILYRIMAMNSPKGTRRSLVVHMDKLKKYRAEIPAVYSNVESELVPEEEYSVRESVYSSNETSPYYNYQTKSGRVSRKPQWFGISW